MNIQINSKSKLCKNAAQAQCVKTFKIYYENY